MSISPPDTIWWKPVHPKKKLWFTLAIIWLLFTFFLMPVLHVVGKQNPPDESYKIDKEKFRALATDFIQKYQVKDANGNPVSENGVPVVHPPAGGDAYLVARAWAWEPILELEKGQKYRIHLSSMDFQHGLSIYPINLNVMAIPGQDYILKIKPTTSGEFNLLCNEFCGIGHHSMAGKLIVR